MVKTFEITVRGKVQGVFYRQSTMEKAKQLGLSGEIQNLKNGDVFITASGDETQLEHLISWCRIGPSKAEVTEIVINEIPLQTFNSFIIRR